MMNGVILYGPPAAGKDTITESLTALDVRYQMMPRVKVGGGRTAGYRILTAEALDELRAAGHVIWEINRYHATYALDRRAVVAALDDGRTVPVVHLGQVPAIEALIRATTPARWLVVYLWCPREVAAQRISARATGDDVARLVAWDETDPLPDADLIINTADVDASEAARMIHAFSDGTLPTY